MWKIIKSIILVIVLFAVCFILTRFILEKVEIVKEIKTSVNCVWSFLIANSVNLLKIYFDNKKDITKRISGISILVRAVTCIRKTKRRDGLPEVAIGEGKNFVYVIAALKNVGENGIVQCTINERRLEVGQIGKGECCDFCFRVCRGKNEKFKKLYVIDLEFKDDKDTYYVKKFKLKIDEEKQNAEISFKGKQKRRRYHT